MHSNLFPTILRLFAVVTLVLATGSRLSAQGFHGGGDGSSAGSGDPQDLILMLIYATVALGFSFLCSVAEAVVLSITPSYIASLKKQGDSRVPLLEGVKLNIDRSLAAILTLNTIAHTVGAGGAGAKAEAYFGSKYFGLAMAVLTLLILLVSEIIPKTIGAVYWRQLAAPSARFVKWISILLLPLIWVSELLTKLLTGDDGPPIFTREEFSAMAELGAEKGQLDPGESRILTNLLRFPELRAMDIMTPRTVVFALQQDLTSREVMEQHDEIAFSRLPIYAENRDEVSGFVLRTDLLLDQYRNEGQSVLKQMRREISAVDGAASLTQVLQKLLDHDAHILLVVDEHGGMEGLVTLEDVVETMMGIEIVDEADQHTDMREVARQKWEQRMKTYGINAEPAPQPPNAGDQSSEKTPDQ